MSWLGGGRRGEGVVTFLCIVLLAGRSDGIKIPDAGMKLTKEDLYFLFGDQEAPPHSVINIKTKSREKRSSPSLTENPGFLDVTLDDNGQKVEFELRPNYNVVSPNFRLVVHDEDGVVEEQGLARPSCLYYGVAKNKPDTIAALANCDGRGFTGVIMSGNQSHLLRPLKKLRQRRQAALGDDLTPDGLHVIHTRGRTAKCGVNDIQAMTAPRHIVVLSGDEGHQDHDITKRDASSGRQIETAVFVDDEMYKFINDEVAEDQVLDTVQDHVFAIMNGVNILYNAPTLDMHFTITLVRLDIIKAASKGPSKAEGDIQRYLSTFCTWQRKLNREVRATETWDHALMLSGLDLYDGDPEYDSVIGLAWVSGMCHPSYSCTINEGTSFEAVYVIAHEMGHNLGMRHDGTKGGNSCDGNKFLMSASTGPGKVTWSTCSNSELKKFIEDYKVMCLDDRSRGPRRLELDKDELPGELFGQDSQCTFAEGTTFKPYVTSKGPYNYCINGQCVRKPNRVTLPPTRPPPSTLPSPTSEPDNSGGSGFSNILRRIRDLFRRYLSLRSDLPDTVFMSCWRLTQMTPCSAVCGGGWQVGRVTCMGAEGNIALDDHLCDLRARPPAKLACNTFPCSKHGARAETLSFPSG